MLPLFILLISWHISSGDKCTEWTKGPQKTCYKLCLNPTPFHFAEHECKKYGGRLASIHDKSENDFVFDGNFPSSLSK
ncbi:hypothetical protein TELCIR_14575 [Teladorsagia circumcincta]|uniref:C-type lectin domain-containing protein n=1 Tax=Teladorsagia circumcincta TaxID=45464 RepID=A0A2G9U0Q4_TELCI|nr:hypothetical protein TELCIR_14575 [Teladorsagia circumcincta]